MLICTAAGDINDAQYARPLPWIGVYIATASLLCAAAMAYDAHSGFRRRRFWFPPRLFSLNAATLTLLGVATKFPLDLDTSMPRPADQLAKLSGTVLICTAIANFMPSLGGMNASGLLSNVAAVGILAVTVIVNVAIQIGTGVIYVFLPEHAIIMLLMVVLLAVLVSSALPALYTKRLLEAAYNKKCREDCADEGSENSSDDLYSLPKLKKYVKKHWLMAHTCSPKYVLELSAACSASGPLCLLAAAVLTEALLRALVQGSHMGFCRGTSDYRWSTALVLAAQVLTIVIGTLAPAYRWIYVGSIRSAAQGEEQSCRSAFEVEHYWVKSLLDWKIRILLFRPSSRRGRKIAHQLKLSVCTMLIRLQTGVVSASKFVGLGPILVGAWIHKRTVVPFCRTTQPFPTLEAEDLELDQEDHTFTLHMESERDWVELITRLEVRDMQTRMEWGRKNRPTTLIELIKCHSTVLEGFRVVGAFDSDTVRCLLPEEPPNCWILPVVALASIAVALPGIDQSLVKSLVRGVSEGLGYIRLVERNLEGIRHLIKVRKKAHKIWWDGGSHGRWFLGLRSSENMNKNGKEVIDMTGSAAKNYVLEHVGKLDDQDSEANGSNIFEWPAKVLVANCVYRACATILRDYDAQQHRTDDDLFAWLQGTISDILGACLTNLPRVIYIESFVLSSKRREERVRDAAVLLGEVYEILQILENPDIKRLFPREKAYLDDWRKREEMGPSSLPPTSSNIISTLTSDLQCHRKSNAVD